MPWNHLPTLLPSRHLVVVRPEPAGQFTAQVVGLPEVRATASTTDEAVEQARRQLTEWLATAVWVQVEAPAPFAAPSLLHFAGQVSPDDPMERAYLEELDRYRRQDLDQTLRDYEPECSDTSSTPTT